MDENTVEILCEILLGAFSGLFALILVIRHRALSSVARRKTQKFSQKVKNARIGLQLLNIGLYSISLVFQATGTQLIGNDDLSYARFYSFFWVPPIVVGVFAILIENKEFGLKIPMMIFHFLYYSLQFLISASLLFYVMFEKSADDANFFLSSKPLTRFSRCGLQFIIVLFYFYRRQDISEFMDMGWIIWDLDNELYHPFVEQNEQEEFSRIQEGNASMEVILASDINIDQNGVPMIKFTVKLDPKNSEEGSKQRCGLAKKKYEIQEQLSNFLQLQQDIQKEMQKDLQLSDSMNSEISSLHFSQYDNVRRLEQEQVEELRQKLQGLFKVMCNNPKYYYDCFLDFLHIGKGYRAYFLNQKANSSNEMLTKIRRTIHENNFIQLGGEIYENNDGFMNQITGSSSQTIDYFELTIEQYQEPQQEHISYEMSIRNLQNNLSCKLAMRYSDLRWFHSQLKESFERLPPFPQKKFITSVTPAFLKERLKKLKLYLEILLNDEEYNQNRVIFSLLSNFFTSDSKSQQEHSIGAISLNLRFSNSLYNGWRASKTKHSIQMEDVEKKGFTVYQFMIYEGNTSKGLIERRFKEFSKLHDYLALKFLPENLPELPPKISHFNTNIPKDRRQSDLENYLNQIFQIPGIGTCYYFRQFFRDITFNRTASNLAQPQSHQHSRSESPRINCESVVEDGECEDDEMNREELLQSSQDHLNSVKIDQLEEFGSQFNSK